MPALIGSRTVLLLLLLAASAARADATAPRADGVAVHVAIETFGIDRKGTWSAGADEADLLPSAPGVLEKTLTLSGRDARRTAETVMVRARFTSDPAPPDGAACSLAAEFETRRESAAAGAAGKTGGKDAGKHAGKGSGAGTGTIAASGVIDTRTATVTLAAGEERLLEVYSSPLIEGRVAMRVSCAPSRAEARSIPDLVTIDLSVEKDAEGEPAEVLRNQRLVAALGREASAVVTANATLPDDADGGKRYRRERIEATLTPALIVSGKLQLEIQFAGEIATVSASGRSVSHPIDRKETFIVGPNETRSFVIDVASGGPDEGWAKLKLTVDVTARF
jgi:hypothetical protein